MVEAAMTQDILKHKSKFFGNFTVREGCALGIALGLGLWGYFSLFKEIEGDMRIYLTALITLPVLAVGFIKIFNQPFEKIIGIIIYDNFITPANRVYELRYPEYEKYQKGLPYKNVYEPLITNNINIPDKENKTTTLTKKETLTKEEKKQHQLALKQKKIDEKNQQKAIKEANKPKKPAKSSKAFAGVK